MKTFIVVSFILLSACAKESKGGETISSECTPLLINGVQAEGWHEFAQNDTRWAKGYQCGACEKFVSTTGAPTEDLVCN